MISAAMPVPDAADSAANVEPVGIEPTAIDVDAADRFRLGASWFAANGAAPRATVIVNAGMAIPQTYYAPFAAAAAARGFDVLTYDYRGIGRSRPSTLAGFTARASDWMTLDFEAMLRWARATLRPAPVFVVGHSFGGNALGLAPSVASLDGAVLVAAQSGYWGHWPVPQRYLFWLVLKTLMPGIARAFGYYPRWAGMDNEVPRDVVLQWTAWCRARGYVTDDAAVDTAGYARFSAPLKLIAITDDLVYAPPAAVRALQRQYAAAPSEFEQIEPNALGLPAVGHFGFFKRRCTSLWPHVLDWLDERRLVARKP